MQKYGILTVIPRHDCVCGLHKIPDLPDEPVSFYAAFACLERTEPTTRLHYSDDIGSHLHLQILNLVPEFLREVFSHLSYVSIRTRVQRLNSIPSTAKVQDAPCCRLSPRSGSKSQ